LSQSRLAAKRPVAYEIQTVSPPSIPPASRAFYRPELDGLRFFAFLAVFASHTLLQIGEGEHHRRLSGAVVTAIRTLKTGGGFGVDLFFVLSAYLITELLQRERRARGTVDVRAFYVRRVLRIWPLYFAFLALAYALTFVVPTEQMTWRHLLGFALLCGNWAYLISPVATVAAPLWSVSLEEQFYLLWPVVMRNGSTRRLIRIALGLVAFGIVVRLGLGIVGVSGQWIAKNSFTRVDGIAAGILLAAGLDGRLPRLGNGARSAVFAGSILTLLVVAAGVHVLHGAAFVVHQALGWPLAAAGCAGIVVSVLGADAPLAGLLASAPVIYLGRISYGLYVFHELGLLCASAIAGRGDSPRSWLVHAGLAFFLTMAMAATSYRWLEGPFLRLKERRFTRVHSRPRGLVGLWGGRGDVAPEATVGH
jgi:peptidoglycan/LPS O-acetylase OafA/YrhL